MSESAGAWAALAALGALHGINPGMGWLFAVARGMQQGERRAVWRALLPLATGHAGAIVLAVAVATVLGLVVPEAVLRWTVIGALAALGVRQLVRHRHPRVGGMRIGDGALAAWSFLVASAHGAGLMAVPFATSHAAHGAHAGAVALSRGTLLATAIHSAGYLLMTGVLAVLVYDRAGTRLLRRAWINVDALWACSLLLTAVALAASGGAR